MKKLINNSLLVMLASLSLVFVQSCSDDHDDDHDHENELITTAKLTFTNTISNTIQTFSWRQPGGPGTAITFDTIRLYVDSTYFTSIQVLDESKTPATDITPEIRLLKDEHQFFYYSGINRLVISNLDKDNRNLPLGLTFTAQTSANGNELSQLRVVLKHYTDAAPKSTDPQAGSTDLDISLPLIVK